MPNDDSDRTPTRIGDIVVDADDDSSDRAVVVKNAAANRDYIDAIRDRGRPDPEPIVRDCGDRFELLNGHKRVWASDVAGLEAIPCESHYQRDLDAARTWARYHLDGYSPAERRVALRRIESHLDTQQGEHIGARICPDDVVDPTTESTDATDAAGRRALERAGGAR